MKNKFVKAIVYIVFSLILLIVAVLPAFAVGGGYAPGSNFQYVAPPCPISFSFYRADFNSDTNAYDWSYSSIPLDPCFNLSPSALGSYRQSFYYYSIYDVYFSSYSGDMTSIYGSGFLSCNFIFSNITKCDSLLIDARDFYAWSGDFRQGGNSYNSEFIINLEYDPSSMYFNDFATVKFSYRPIANNFDENGYTEVELPLSDFLIEDQLVLDPGLFFDSLGSEKVYYHVRDFVVRIPCSYFYGSNSLYGDVTYVYDSALYDPTNLYPTIRGSIELQDYTSWVTTALSGFLNFQIFPGFYLSGFLMVIIAFSTFIWFLKIFAGG